MKLEERVQLMLDLNRVTQTFDSDLAGNFYRIKYMKHKDE
jgi:hypothetical protein